MLVHYYPDPEDIKQKRYIKTECISSFMYVNGDIYKKILIVCGGVQHLMYLPKYTEESKITQELIQLQRSNDDYRYEFFTIVNITD